MNISQNLLQSVDLWTKDDVQKWIQYCIDEYALSDINLNLFQMNGKALLLLNEDGFKQRTPRCGDVLYKALQQHNALLKSIEYQNYSYSLWSNYNTYLPPSVRQFDLALPVPSMSSLNHHSFDYMNPEQSLRNMSNLSSSSAVNVLEKTFPRQSVPAKGSMPAFDDIYSQFSIGNCVIPKKPQDKVTETSIRKSNKHIRFYKDRIDFHGDIIFKPEAAKNCRILWEFLYILLEDPLYESIIRWENRSKRIFRIVQADKLAALWGLQKNRLSMTYEKLSRGMRYYYSNSIISKEQSKRLLYRFVRSPEEIRNSMRRHPPTVNPKTEQPAKTDDHFMLDITTNEYIIIKQETSNTSHDVQADTIKDIPILAGGDQYSYQPLDLVLSRDNEYSSKSKRQKIAHTTG